MRTKGSMYCLNENKPVAAHKGRARISGLFYATWHCPTCGGPAVHKDSTQAKRARKKEAKAVQ